MLPRTGEAYQHLASSKGLPIETVDHPDTGCKSHWIGSPAAKKVLLYFHGGGYVMPASAAHVEYLYRLCHDVNTTSGSGDTFSILMLGYSLAPEVAYPIPLAQAAECLNYLLTTNQRDPSSILIGGDSAGGNLALGLLSHIIHPHPSVVVPRVVELKTPLAGALIISPWVEFEINNVNRGSIKERYYSDVSSPTSLQTWGQHIRGGNYMDNYMEPINADVKWWEGLDQAVSQILMWGGGGEILIDGIKVVMDKMQSAYPAGVQNIIGYNMCHEEMVVDVMLNYDKGESAFQVENWIKARL